MCSWKHKPESLEWSEPQGKKGQLKEIKRSQEPIEDCSPLCSVVFCLLACLLLSAVQTRSISLHRPGWPQMSHRLALGLQKCATIQTNA